jgi:hypothetical protein
LVSPESFPKLAKDLLPFISKSSKCEVTADHLAGW